MLPLAIAPADARTRYRVDSALWLWWGRVPPVTDVGMRAEVEWALTGKVDGEPIPCPIFPLHEDKLLCDGRVRRFVAYSVLRREWGSRP